MVYDPDDWGIRGATEASSTIALGENLMCEKVVLACLGLNSKRAPLWTRTPEQTINTKTTKMRGQR
jgi:hypothetical protein